MSLLIKGMEMPTDCIFCPMFRGAWTMCTVLNKTTRVRGRPDDCPLVPVPPHGRLIDADAIETELWKMRAQYQMLDDSQTADKIMHGLYRAEQLLKDAPTIIPAEEGE